MLSAAVRASLTSNTASTWLGPSSISSDNSGNRDVWVLDSVRGVTSRLTFDPAIDDPAMWSPDGLRVLWASNRSGVFDLYVKSANGAPQPQAQPQMQIPMQTSGAPQLSDATARLMNPAISAIGNLVEALRGNLPPRESADPKAVLLILAGLALLIAIIGLGGGFILAATALFVTTSAAFGRRAILADLAIALVMTTLIYLAFDRLLTLSLPAGPLERLL